MAEKVIKWEYKAIQLMDPRECGQFDVLGSAGWELVCVFCQKNEAAFAYFKRELKK